MVINIPITIMKHRNFIQIIQSVSKAIGVKDARQDDYLRIVVTFHDDATVEDREDVKEYMEDVGYTIHKTTKHKIKFKKE